MTARHMPPCELGRESDQLNLRPRLRDPDPCTAGVTEWPCELPTMRGIPLQLPHPS